MKILMMTNTYLPHVGGVARSVASFAAAFRSRGHEVLVVTPEFDGTAPDEDHVIRIPAIQHFNGSDFSVVLPIPGFLSARLQDFSPDLVHSHHPFLVGSTAVRVATQRNIPLVYTYHTHYEQYTHYAPVHSPRMRGFAVELAKGYCNLCHHVIAPSESVEQLLRERGVLSPITSIPTGIRTDRFARGDGGTVRQNLGIPEGTFVVGTVGRLAEEKNLSFLSGAVARFLQTAPGSRFLVVGNGPSKEKMVRMAHELGVGDRFHFTGTLSGQALIDAYHAMDLFAFASMSETQGLVLAEAMAAGVPVVALDASGVREVIDDGVNGRLLEAASPRAFAGALREMFRLSPEGRRGLSAGARRKAQLFSLDRCSQRLLAVYDRAVADGTHSREPGLGFWEMATEQLRVEWELLRNVAGAAVSTLHEGRPPQDRPGSGRP